MPQVSGDRLKIPRLKATGLLNLISARLIGRLRDWLGLSRVGAIFTVLLPACGVGLFLGATTLAGTPLGKLTIVASIIPLGDFCRQLGGEGVEVQVLIPPGASPHVFEPLPSVIAKAAQARLFVCIGAGLEPWAAKVLSSRRTEAPVVVEAAQGFPLIQEVAGHRHAEASKLEPGPHYHKPPEHKPPAAKAGGLHQSGNPHIWLDPVLAGEICRKIAAALILVDPERRRTYETNLKNYLKDLEDLDQEILTRVSAWRLKDYVCFHPAYTYFARRYGLREVGVIEVAPGREPTPRHLQKIVAAIRQYGIRVVFAEPQLSPRVAEVIAQEAGVKVLILDPMGGRPPYGSDYLKMMRYNLNTLEEAMK